MKRVLTAAVLIPVVLLVVFKAPLWVFTLVVAAIATLAVYEYLNITRAYGVAPIRWPTYGVTLFLVLGAFAYTTDSIAGHARLAALLYIGMALAGAALVFGIPIIFRRDMKMALAASGISAFAVVYIGAPFAVLILLRWEPFEGVFLLFALLSVWAGDTAAFYIGRSLGRHKLAPTVSPNKTWEGAIASVIASVAVAFIIFHFGDSLSHLFTLQKSYLQPPLPVVHRITLGILTNVAAQLGDLFESAIKRGAQVKDSGSLLPGHGGILDRIDALLFALPVVWYYATLAPIATLF